MSARRGGILKLFKMPPSGFRAAFFVVAMMAYSTAGFLYFEKPQKPDLAWGDAFWWTIVTMSTVGYGDYSPASLAGRLLVGMPAMLTGVGILGYVLSQLAAFIIRVETLMRKGQAMQRVVGHIIVCNLGSTARLTRLIAEMRTKHGFTSVPVVLVDQDLAELDDELARHDVHFVRGHPARAHTLEMAGVAEALRAVVLAKDARDPLSDNLTVATCLTLRNLRPDMHIVAECVDPENQELLERAGCKSIVCVLDLAPGILAHELHDPGVVDVLEELTVWEDNDNNVFVVPVSLDGGAPRTVADLHRWGMANGVTLLGVRTGERVTVNPPASRSLAVGDAAVVISRARPERIPL